MDKASQERRRLRRWLIVVAGLLLASVYLDSLSRGTTAQQVSIIQSATFPSDI